MRYKPWYRCRGESQNQCVDRIPGRLPRPIHSTKVVLGWKNRWVVWWPNAKFGTASAATQAVTIQFVQSRMEPIPLLRFEPCLRCRRCKAEVPNYLLCLPWNKDKAFSEVMDAIRESGAPVTSDNFSAVCNRKAGSFRFPRCGVGGK